MLAEIVEFPKTRKEMIQAMINTASELEEISPEECIQIQNKVIVMLIKECNRSTKIAKAALRTLTQSENESR